MTAPAPGEPGPTAGPPAGRPDPDPAAETTSVDPDPSGRTPPADPGAFGADWDAALDAALDEFDRPQDGSTDLAGSAAPGTAGTADGPAGNGVDPGGRRRAGLRASLTTLSARMMTERAFRGTGAPGATADERAAETGATGQAEPGRPYHSPFNWGFFGGLGLVLAYVTYLVLDTIRDTLLLLAIATLLAIGLNPLVSLLERHGVRRGGAVGLVFMALLAVITAAVFAIIPPIVTELISFVGSVPQLINDLQHNPTVQSLDQRFGLLEALRNSNIVQSLGSGAAGGILNASFVVASIFIDLVIILILTLYFLAGFPRIKAAAYRLVPATRRPRVIDLGDRILKQMGGYLSGATIIALQAGLIAGIFASIIGLPYPWAIALGAAVLDFIPVVGPIIIGVSMTLLGFTQSLAVGIIAGVFYLCQHLFEAYWLYPRVMRRAVEISTGAVVVAILIGAALLGVTGAILAVPVAAAIMLIVREVIMPMQEGS